MKDHRYALLVALVTSAASAQQAAQWRVEDGGNGHWYVGRLSQVRVTWEQARDAAQREGGHLVTVTSLSENSFAFSVVANRPELWAGNSYGGPWIGARQPNPSSAASAAWSWVTDETWQYVNWAAGEPNDQGYQGGRESYLQFVGQGRWNDFTNDGNTAIFSYVIEWSADCNGDGIIDYGQILAGHLADADADGVPDLCQCPGDITRNGIIDGVDLSAVLGAWGTDGQNQYDCDVDDDGVVAGPDLAYVLSGWGPCP